MSAIIFATLAVYTLIVAWYLIRINRRTYNMSIVDANTGLLNRSAYETYLEENRTKFFSYAACIYIDANGLHEMNNRYGHAKGDMMLQAVADALQMEWSDSGVYRIGGDEFVVFPQIADEKACRSSIQKLTAVLAEHNYSISVGFAFRENETGLDRVVKEADEDMLKHKAEYYAEHKKRKSR